MSFTIIQCAQRSPEWFQARLGRITGTSANDLQATIKSGEAAARRDLRLRLICERLTGQSQEDGYVNPAMMRGIDCEPLARAAYEAKTGELIEETGFLSHDELMAGCSLDGHIAHFQGIVELKCPKSSTHLRYLRAGILPPEHVGQVTHNVWISGAKWADFCSWDDRFPPELQFLMVRVLREDLDVAGYEKRARAFLAEVDTELAAVRTMSDLRGTLELVAKE